MLRPDTQPQMQCPRQVSGKFINAPAGVRWRPLRMRIMLAFALSTRQIQSILWSDLDSAPRDHHTRSGWKDFSLLDSSNRELRVESERGNLKRDYLLMSLPFRSCEPVNKLYLYIVHRHTVTKLQIFDYLDGCYWRAARRFPLSCCPVFSLTAERIKTRISYLS